MGYRLEMSKIKYSACGGKLYGYVGDEKELKSYQWLLKRNYVDGTEFWSYGFNPQIILNHDEFKEFIELYKEDFEKERGFDYPYKDGDDIQELINSGDDVLLEWW